MRRRKSRRHTGLDEGHENLKRIGLRIALPAILIASALLIGRSAARLEADAQSLYPVVATRSWTEFSRAPTKALLLASEDLLSAVPPPPLGFESGETLGGVLEGLGLGSREAGEVIEELGRFADLRKLRPSDQYSAQFGENDLLESFELMLASRGRARVERREGAWSGSWRSFERTVRTTVLAGRLESALELAIEEAGGPPALSILMSEVFQWDLDFNRDLRRSDSFNVLFESVYLDGVYESLGDIIAISYDNGGRRLEAYRFGESGLYFDPDGRPMRKMFLRSPLRYSRVTSRFSNRRFHPILKRYRPHHGVDYGAPTGTPVRVTANGSVTFAGWDRGGGKTIKVRHPNGYLSAYLHLSRFASGVRSGRRVLQGDVIGYVGSTGLSTAPHLDYRVQKNGRWIDPLSLRSVPADPVPTERLPEYLAWRDQLRATLFEGAPLPMPASTGDSRLASNEPDEQTSRAGGAR